MRYNSVNTEQSNNDLQKGGNKEMSEKLIKHYLR